MKQTTFQVNGMTCAACEAAVKRSVSKLDGTDNIAINVLTGKMKLSYDESKVSESDIIQAVTNAGYEAESYQQDKKTSAQDDLQVNHFAVEAQEMKKRLYISIPFLIILMYFSMGTMFGAPNPGFLSGPEGAGAFALLQLLLTLPIFIVNKNYFTRGLKALFKRSPNMDSLIAVGSLSAFVYGIFALFRILYGQGFGQMEIVHHYMHDLYFESAATILTLITLGKYLELRSKSKTSDSIKRLMDLQPKSARVLRDGVEVELGIEELSVGDLIIIKPGESIPVDGIITEGETSIDESTITGESIPIAKALGDEVISATMNQSGSIVFRATKVGEDSTISKIIQLVEDANASKAPIQSLADKISSIFVPVVIAIAVLTFIVWMLFTRNFEFALRLAITVLVISCPCALGLATPVAIMVATGKAAEFGVLFKSAEALEVLHEAKAIVFDKTGTLTEGRPYVTDVIYSDAWDHDAFIRMTASIEQKSEQPLAKAILSLAEEKNLNLYDVEAFQSVAGRGIEGALSIDNRNIEMKIGNLQHMQDHHVDTARWTPLADTLANQGKTPMYVAIDAECVGIIAAADIVKNNSKVALDRICQTGVQTIMLSGDNQRTAKAIANEINVQEYYADVLPQDKDQIIQNLQKKYGNVVMVGDGVNDAPALTRANVGVAIGAGTDVAIESADLVLIQSDLMDVLSAYQLSKKTVRVIKQNLFWAFFYNVILIPLAAGVLYPAFKISLNPMLAAFAMSISSLFVVGNALRLRQFKKQEEERYIRQSSTTANVHYEAIPTLEVEDKENTLKVRKEKERMKKIVYVEGMTCMHCKAHVEKAIAGVEGVVHAEVDLEKGQAVFESDNPIEEGVIKEAIQEAGYEVKGFGD